MFPRSMRMRRRNRPRHSQSRSSNRSTHTNQPPDQRLGPSPANRVSEPATLERVNPWDSRTSDTAGFRSALEHTPMSDANVYNAMHKAQSRAAKRQKIKQRVAKGGKIGAYTGMAAASLGHIILGIRADRRDEGDKNFDLGEYVTRSNFKKKKSGYSAEEEKDAMEAAMRKALDRQETFSTVVGGLAMVVISVAVGYASYWGLQMYRRHSSKTRLAQLDTMLELTSEKLRNVTPGTIDDDDLQLRRKEIEKEINEIKEKLGTTQQV